MAKPSRNSDRRDVVAGRRTFFVTTRAASGTHLVHPGNLARLFIDVLRSYTLQGRLRAHEFVVMPDHVHILLSIGGNTSIEKAVQLIKGGFSFRATRELGYQGNVWQRGFSEVRVVDRASYLGHVNYINDNPVKAGLADSAENYPYCSAFLRKQKRIKAARLKFVPCYEAHSVMALVEPPLGKACLVRGFRQVHDSDFGRHTRHNGLKGHFLGLKEQVFGQRSEYPAKSRSLPPAKIIHESACLRICARYFLI